VSNGAIERRRTSAEGNNVQHNNEQRGLAFQRNPPQLNPNL
jgi:hypothetical protein